MKAEADKERYAKERAEVVKDKQGNEMDVKPIRPRPK